MGGLWGGGKVCDAVPLLLTFCGAQKICLPVCLSDFVWKGVRLSSPSPEEALWFAWRKVSEEVF